MSDPHLPFWRRRGVWIALFLLLALSAVRTVIDLKPFLVYKQGAEQWFDLYVMTDLLREYQRTGRLYDTSKPDSFDPKTTSMFKYPPPNAALILSLVPVSKPPPTIRPLEPRPPAHSGRDPKLRALRQAARRGDALRSVRPLLVFYLLTLGATLAFCIVSLRPTWERTLLMAALFLNWQANVESLGGPQIEPLLLLLLAGAAWSYFRRKLFLAGVPIGIAGAFKAYPWGLLLVFILRRQWRGALGVAVGAAATFLLSGIIVPLGFSLEWLVRIFPKLNGLVVDSENVSVLGNLAHLALTVAGKEHPRTLYLLSGQWLSDPAVAVPLVAALVAFAALLVLVIRVTCRCWPRAHGMEEGRRNVLWMALCVCLLTAFMPTSWLNYQTLLVLPLMVGLALAPRPALDPLTWVLILYMGAAGAIYSGACTPYTTVPRSLIPLAGWWVCVRLLGRNQVASGASSAAPVAAPGPDAVVSLVGSGGVS